jgi:hypothetical protein
MHLPTIRFVLSGARTLIFHLAVEIKSRRQSREDRAEKTEMRKYCSFILASLHCDKCLILASLHCDKCLILDEHTRQNKTRYPNFRSRIFFLPKVLRVRVRKDELRKLIKTTCEGEDVCSVCLVCVHLCLLLPFSCLGSVWLCVCLPRLGFALAFLIVFVILLS